MLSENSTVVVTKDQVSADLSGEAAILNLKTSTYFGLNTIGASIWKLIQEPKTVGQIRDAITEEYDVEPDRCERDILELLQELSKNGLIEIIVEDKGCGFDMTILENQDKAFGITGMQERVVLVGGLFDIQSQPGEGTLVHAIFPAGQPVERRHNDR